MRDQPIWSRHCSQNCANQLSYEWDESERKVIVRRTARWIRRGGAHFDPSRRVFLRLRRAYRAVQASKNSSSSMLLRRAHRTASGHETGVRSASILPMTSSVKPKCSAMSRCVRSASWRAGRSTAISTAERRSRSSKRSSGLGGVFLVFGKANHHGLIGRRRGFATLSCRFAEIRMLYGNPYRIRISVIDTGGVTCRSPD